MHTKPQHISKVYHYWRGVCLLEFPPTKHRRVEEIEKLRLSKPRAFWKYFRKKNQKSKESISLNDFFTYFSNLENDSFTCRNEESENLCNGVKLSSVSSLS